MKQQEEKKGLEVQDTKDILERVRIILGKEWVKMLLAEEKHYVIEVNKGIYLYKYRIGGYAFTDDIRMASLYEYNNCDEAINIAKECGDKITKYVITHEVE